MRNYSRSFWFAAFLCLCACSGGGSKVSPALGPQQAPAGGLTAIAMGSVLLGAQPANATLPVIAQITGTLRFPAVGFADTLTLSASATAPAGIGPQSERRAQSGTLTVYEYISISSPVTITLPSIPALTLTFPASTPLAGKSVFYGLSNLDAQGGKVSFDTQGPGTLTGHTVSFAGVPTPLTLAAGHSYTFVVYATTSNAQLLYVTNAAANSITAYALPAQGNVAPARTISGAITGLSHPSAIAVDASGNIVVVNATSVEIFADGANGNVRPLATLAISAEPAAIALDPGNGNIYVSRPKNQKDGIIDVYSRSGTLTRSISQIPNSLWGFLIQGLAVDKSDQLFVGITFAGRDVCAPQIFEFAPNASGPTSPIADFGAGACSNNAKIAYAAHADELFQVRGTDYFSSVNQLVAYANGTFAVVRKLDNLLDQIQALAVDADGTNVYALEADNAIRHFTADAGSSFVTNLPISGSLTGLSQPSGIAIGIP